MSAKTKYAKVSWNAHDVQSLMPGWTLQMCEEWLAESERDIQDRTIEKGWEVLEFLLGGEK